MKYKHHRHAAVALRFKRQKIITRGHFTQQPVNIGRNEFWWPWIKLRLCHFAARAFSWCLSFASPAHPPFSFLTLKDTSSSQKKNDGDVFGKHPFVRLHAGISLHGRAGERADQPTTMAGSAYACSKRRRTSSRSIELGFKWAGFRYRNADEIWPMSIQSWTNDIFSRITVSLDTK